MKKETFIGQLNQRIFIKKKNDVKSDVSGSTTKKLIVFKECWAKVVDVSSSEKLDGKVVYVNVKDFIIRHDVRLGSALQEMQIEYKGLNYEVISVLAQGKGYLKLKGVHRE
ncbi:conserved protein of unknown function [Tenacibaculum sp. 190524A02b]|uniref:phage head closure protein n=1 Tax=Tenacibaculum vairaonense TaxID=3137860 RepID=UPI0032B16A7B